MNTTILLIIVNVLLLCSVIAGLYLSRKRQHLLDEDMASLKEANQRYARQLKHMDEELHEIRSGNMGIGVKVQELISAIKLTQVKQEALAEQDPQSRFYNQAAKLVAGGATIEDVMRECDIPKAEAELLFSLHQK
ncbi:MAG: mRNA-degrading endonuclease RelE of RelBE toxin-antitoxin system [Paraglaciecola sp.]|jgi:mRNA-degrading endonuclease RelE of RelBE toxin-antitoxin system